MEYRQTPGVCEGHLKTEESLKFRNQTSTELEIKQLSRMNSMGMILFWVAVADPCTNTFYRAIHVLPALLLAVLTKQFFSRRQKKIKMIQNV